MTERDAQLDLKTTAELLDLPEQAVLRWARIGALPSQDSSSSAPTFERGDVLDWARNMGMRLPHGEETEAKAPAPNALAAAMRRGCIVDGVEAATPAEAIQKTVAALPDLPELGLEGIDRESFCDELLQREELAPTAIGFGFAVPHSRKPLGKKLRDCRVILARLASPIDWQALDGSRVDTLLLVLSNKLEAQLELLRRVSLAMRDVDVRAKLRREALPALCDAIEAIRDD